MQLTSFVEQMGDGLAANALADEDNRGYVVGQPEREVCLLSDVF